MHFKMQCEVMDGMTGTYIVNLIKNGVNQNSNLQASDLHTGVQPPELTRKQLHKPCYSRKLLKLPFLEKIQTPPLNRLQDPIAQTSLTHPLVLLFLFLIRIQGQFCCLR